MSFLFSVILLSARFTAKRQVFISLLALMLALPATSSARPPEPKSEHVEAKQQTRQRTTTTVVKPKQLKQAKNREALTMHPRWTPGTLASSDVLWQLLPEERLTPEMETSLRIVIDRLKKQLGKPYVWGGNSPEKGFDCSGLVFYAYNHVLHRKLPRTANGMYHDGHLRNVHLGKLRRGDLVFFNINRRPGADHVGVYLGNGKFIEAPRKGRNIRISHLSNSFWQNHFLGARRILTEEALLLKPLSD